MGAGGAATPVPSPSGNLGSIGDGGRFSQRGWGCPVRARGYGACVAKATAFLDVPPEAVWAVLADATTYVDWVVGCRRVRSVEGDWPAVGAAFHHSFGAGPTHVNDKTVVLECEPPRRLVLEARAFPVGSAWVEFTLSPAATGTHVVMDERPLRPLAFRLTVPLIAGPTVVRNAVTLRRLGDVARRRAAVGRQGIEP